MLHGKRMERTCDAKVLSCTAVKLILPINR